MKNLLTPLLKKFISFFLILLMIFHVTGCNYFRAKSFKDDYPTIKDIGKIHKQFIVHFDQQLFALENVSVNSAALSGDLLKLNSAVYFEDGRKSRFKENERDILNEVHIYISNGVSELPMGEIDIPLANISEIKVINKDTGKTIFAFLGVVLGIFLILAIIIAATKSSCPYIYVFDGEEFVFEGETFGGAIGQNLERDDYMPLPSISSENSEYRIRISNELKEKQYIDLAELIVFIHPKGQKILLDKNGDAQVIQKLEQAYSSKSFSGTDLSSKLKNKDSDAYFFNDNNSTKNGILLNFKKPKEATTGKLVINGKNSLWADYIVGEVWKKFGSSFDNWMEKQAKLPSSDRLQKYIEKNIPLSIYLKQEGEWKIIDYLFTVGPLANRDFVIPIDLTNFSEDELEIKIETGFMFWELDFAGMDFSQNSEMMYSSIKPMEAFGTNTQNWISSLSSADSDYMFQGTIGEFTDVIFPAPPKTESQDQTVFLYTRGYYELIREYEGLPQITELEKFKEPGYFSDFSRDRYFKMLYPDEELASNLSVND